MFRHFIKNDFKRKVKLYDLKEKQPESKIAKRCLDFKKLEEVAKVLKNEKTTENIMYSSTFFKEIGYVT